MTTNAVSSLVRIPSVQERRMPGPKKRIIKRFELPMDQPTADALETLLEILGDRQTASDIVRTAIIEKAEREEKRRKQKDKTA